MSTASQLQYARDYYQIHRDEILINNRAKYEANKEYGLIACLRIYKLIAGCVDCGYRASAVALDFDHVRGEKRFGLAEAKSRRLEEVIAELEKCEVRCANCHRIKTFESR